MLWFLKNGFKSPFMDADGGGTGGAGSEKAEDGAADNNEQTTEQNKEDTKPAGMTQEDVDRIVSKRIAAVNEKHAREIENAKKEAARMAKLSAEERAKEETRLEREAFEADKRRFERERMELGAMKILSDKKLPPTFAGFLIAGDTEETNANIAAFEKAFNEAVEAAVTDKLKGVPPKAGGENREQSGVESAFYDLNPNLKK